MTMKRWNRPQIISINNTEIRSQIEAAAKSWHEWCINGDFR